MSWLLSAACVKPAGTGIGADGAAPSSGDAGTGIGVDGAAPAPAPAAGRPSAPGTRTGGRQPKWRDRGQQRGRQQRQPQLRRLWRLQLLHACLSRPWAGPQVALRAERLSCLLLSCLVSPLRPKVLGIISSSCISQEDCIGCECVYPWLSVSGPSWLPSRCSR